MLLIRLPQDKIDEMTQQAEYGSNAQFSVDLAAQTVTAPDGVSHHFDIDDFRKKCLLEGLDEIALTLAKNDAISSFENHTNNAHGWLTPAT